MVPRIFSGLFKILLCAGIAGHPLVLHAESSCSQKGCSDTKRARLAERDGLEGFGSFAQEEATPTPTPRPTVAPSPPNNGGNNNSAYNDLQFLNSLLQGIIPKLLGGNSLQGIFGGGGGGGGGFGSNANRPQGPLGQGLFGSLDSIDEFFAGSPNRKIKGEECEEEDSKSPGMEKMNLKNAKVITYGSRDSNRNIHNDLVKALGNQGGQFFGTSQEAGFLNALTAAATDQSGQKYVVATACHGAPGGTLQGGVTSGEISNAIESSGTKDASHILLLQGQCYPCTGNKVEDSLSAKGIKPPHHLRGYKNINAVQWMTNGYHHSIANFVNSLNSANTGRPIFPGLDGIGGGGGGCGPFG